MNSRERVQAITHWGVRQNPVQAGEALYHEHAEYPLTEFDMTMPPKPGQ